MLTFALSANASEPAEKAFEPHARLYADLAMSLRGNTHVGYLQYVSLGGTFDTEKANWWRGGSFHASFANTFGSKPSEDWIGDWQYVDCIENGNFTFAEQLWYRQTSEQTDITVGLQDINEYFNWSDATYYYLNGSFQLIPTLGINYNVPSMPANGLGVNLEYRPNDNIALRAGLYDSNVTPLDEDNKYNLRWHFSTQNGLLAMLEMQRSNDKGMLQIGAHYATYEEEVGAYLKADRTLFESDRRKVEAFGQMGAMANRSALCTANICAGANVHGIFGKKEFDAAGLGFSSAFFNDISTETAIEFFYKISVVDILYFQADCQYIINPVGEKNCYNPNAVFATLRLCIDF